MKLKAKSEHAFDEGQLPDGTSYYGMYAELALKEISNTSDNLITSVRPHWVGKVEVWAEDYPDELTWQIAEATEFKESPFPADFSRILQVPKNLPSAPISKQILEFEPTWKNNWEQRSNLSLKELPIGHHILTVDLGDDWSAIHHRETTFIARAANGDTQKLQVKWHRTPQMVYDIELRVYVDQPNQSANNLQLSKPQIEAENFKNMFVLLPWVADIANLQIQEQFLLWPFQFRSLASRPVPAPYVARQYGDLLSQFLRDVIQPNNLSLLIASISTEISGNQERAVETGTDVRRWGHHFSKSETKPQTYCRGGGICERDIKWLIQEVKSQTQA